MNIHCYLARLINYINFADDGESHCFQLKKLNILTKMKMD